MVHDIVLPEYVVCELCLLAALKFGWIDSTGVLLQDKAMERRPVFLYKLYV